MSIGSLESIAQSLATISLQLDQLLPVNTVGTPPTGTDEDAPAPSAKKQAKKVASKKVASKKGGSRGKAKGPDLSDLTIFKKQLFDIAEASGVDDVMPKLKTFIQDEGYETSDKVELADREQFLSDVKTHFAELSDEAGESDETDALEGL